MHRAGDPADRLLRKQVGAGARTTEGGGGRLRFTVGPDEQGRRIDVELVRRTGRPRSAVQDAIRAGGIEVEGRSVRPSHRLAVGEEVTGEIPVVEQAAPEPEDIPIEIRYSDDRVMCVSKPAGLVVHPASGHDSGTLVNALLGMGVELADRRGERPGIVHRLDKGTSGLLLVAKDDEAHASLSRALKAREVKRTYLALVRGRMGAATGTIDAPLGRHPKARRKIAVVPGGRSAVTHYRVLEESDACSLLEVDLETGRTHQIRVHLSHVGHPVLGDPTYGGGTEFAIGLGLRRPFLHASRLEFPHPDDGHIVTVTDPLPEDLAAALQSAQFPIS